MNQKKPGFLQAPRQGFGNRRSAAPARLRRILLSYVLAVTVEFLLTSGPSLADLSIPNAMSASRVLLVTAAFFLLFSVLCLKSCWERVGILAAAGTLCIWAAASCFTWPFLAACLLLVLLFLFYACRGWNGSAPCTKHIAPEQKRWKALTIALTVLFFLFVSLWTVCRVVGFHTPSYDFGIFSQMFYYLKTTGLPLTTLERDGLLSHFAVHVSPIYYLLLPFYCLFPNPAALQVLQAAVMASAVIPLWKLSGRHGLTGGIRFLLCALLLIFPAYAGGAAYDLHENAFLTPLLFWLFYGIDTGCGWLTALAVLMTLAVKEDAAVYVAVVGLYQLVRALLLRDKRNLIVGACLLGGAVLWFFLVTGYLSRSGDGVMTDRYQNLMTDGSLLSVIRTVLLCPMKAVYECVDGEKCAYLALTLLPLLGLPLVTRRYERYLLLIPYILVNLLSDYSYQHSIYFQYNFGSLAFLFYLTVVNVSEFSTRKVQLFALSAAVLISCVLFAGTILPRAFGEIADCRKNAQFNAERAAILSLIPADSSVCATTFDTTALSQREILYDVSYAAQEHLLSCDFVVLNGAAPAAYRRYETADASGMDTLIALLEQNGYEVFADDFLIIYRKGVAAGKK